MSECDLDPDEHEPSLHEDVPKTRKKSSKTPSATSSKAYDKHSWWDKDWNSWGSNWWGTGNGQWTWDKDRGEYKGTSLTTSKSILTPLDELAKLFAELELRLGGKDELIQNLEALVAERWREEALPPILTGWHLLNGAGLTATERSNVISTAGVTLGPEANLESIDLPKIEKALQLAWPDNELAERDDRAERKDSRKPKHKQRKRTPHLFFRILRS